MQETISKLLFLFVSPAFATRSILLQSGDHVVEGGALLHEVVDLLADGAVGGERRVEAHHHAVQTVLKQPDAVRNLVLVAGRRRRGGRYPAGLKWSQRLEFPICYFTHVRVYSSGRVCGGGRGGRLQLALDLALQSPNLGVHLADGALLLVDGRDEVLLVDEAHFYKIH